MRVTASMPAWMVADGEYRGTVVHAEREFGFALAPSSISEGSGERQWRQHDGVVTMSGIVLRRGVDVPPVLDEGTLFPIIATAEPVAAAGTALDIEGRLLVEPYLWAAPGLLRAAVPEGVGPWAVERIMERRGCEATDLDALPGVTDVDHEAVYVLHLHRL